MQDEKSSAGTLLTATAAPRPAQASLAKKDKQPV
jgi:hypothetical protein